ncbi:MAG: alpha/beta hydrolase [Myxococcales bacterium]|nr:alpha/beta hydrolase [Myxococcales bacterium]
MRKLTLELASEGPAVGPTSVSALFSRPDDADVLLVLAHGAGAGMHHSFMQALAERLVACRVAVLRYQFAYMEAGRRRTDAPARAHAAVAAACAAATANAPDLPCFAGGKSFGGRMTSQLAATSALPNVRGLVFFGFPLHPAKKPSQKRAEHLAQVTQPMLFLSGTRDALAELSLLEPLVRRLGARATLALVEGADHGFSVLKRSGRTDDEVLDELAERAASWMRSHG